MTNDKNEKSKDKNDAVAGNFYELFKEILETQNIIIQNQNEIKDEIKKLKGSGDSKNVADLWGGI